MISCLMNLSILLVKIWAFLNVLAECAYKSFLFSEDDVFWNKMEVLCIAYHFRMRVNALKSRSHENSHHPGNRDCPASCRGRAVGRDGLLTQSSV